jgi:hypothetical protein
VFDGLKAASWPAKLVAIFGVGVLLGLGLCGTGASLSEKHSATAENLFIAGAYSFWGSALGLVVVVILLFILGLPKKHR